MRGTRDVGEITVAPDDRSGTVELALRPTPDDDGWVVFKWESMDDDYIDIYPTSVCGMFHIDDSPAAENWIEVCADEILRVLLENGHHPFTTSSTEYAKDGGAFCPVCGSNDMECGDVEYGGRGLRYEGCMCLHCNSTWREEYKLVGYVDLDERYPTAREPALLSDLFRRLDSKEEREFRQWARENWKPGMEISSLWHPVVRDEIRKMQEELNEG